MVRNRAATGTGLIVALLLILLLVLLLTFGPRLLVDVQARYWGLLPLLIAIALVVGTTGQWNPLALAIGLDNRLSLSKAQTLLWTGVVLYAYAGLFAHNLRVIAAAQPPGAPPAPLSFPESVLLVLGFSVTSLIGAAGITAGQVANGSVKKDPAPAPDLSLRWLILDDRERVDLTRFQVVLWTLVGAGVFLSYTWVSATQGAVLVKSLPDVGNALVLLMGFGTATYIGGKLVVTPGKPMVYRASSPIAPRGSAVTLAGSGFGSAGPGSAVRMNGATIAVPDAASWTDTSITFTVPAAQPWNAQPWPVPPATVDVRITVAVGPLESDPVTLTVS